MMNSMQQTIKVLYVSQEIFPFLSEETPLRMLNRKLPEVCQQNGFETRTFMPKFGEINERRNQLHEVIRLSGMNIIINDSDHQLILKVASIQSARIQVYFIDNDDYFKKRKGLQDENGVDYADNDERSVFFARGVMETVKKLRWTPDIIQCSGWMAALIPIYVKKAYHDTPFFTNAKIVTQLYKDDFSSLFKNNYSKMAHLRGIGMKDMTRIANKDVAYSDLMRLGIQFSDAVAIAAPNVNGDLLQYVAQEQKPTLAYSENITPQDYLDFYHQILGR